MPWALPAKELEQLHLDEVQKAIGWRNKIIHSTGRLPRDVPPETIAEAIVCVLALALYLGDKRRNLLSAPAIRAIEEDVRTSHGVDTCSIRSLDHHAFAVECRYWSSCPSSEKMTETVVGLGTRLKTLDARFVPEEHLTVTFEGVLGGAFARWNKGSLETIPGTASS